MNKQNLTDTQNSIDQRGKNINLVGISDLKYPFTFEDSGTIRELVGKYQLGVSLASTQKGTHMSRFIEVLNQNQGINITLSNFNRLSEQVLKTLESDYSRCSVSFTWFIEKKAPVSKVKSMLDYQVSLISESGEKNKKQISVKVPVKSLCPCSKSISDYGAHNQRSYITVTVEANSLLNLKELIEIVEKSSSAELYPILKRVDEKFITEYAYDHALFVEDTVREIALKLDQHKNIGEYRVYSENIESIHNHSAFAELKSPRFVAIEPNL